MYDVATKVDFVNLRSFVLVFFKPKLPKRLTSKNRDPRKYKNNATFLSPGIISTVSIIQSDNIGFEAIKLNLPIQNILVI